MYSACVRYRRIDRQPEYAPQTQVFSKDYTFAKRKPNITLTF